MDGKTVHPLEAVVCDEEVNLKAKFGDDSIYAEGHASAR
jgi:hypothetical protein